MIVLTLFIVSPDIGVSFQDVAKMAQILENLEGRGTIMNFSKCRGRGKFLSSLQRIYQKRVFLINRPKKTLFAPSPIRTTENLTT